MKWIQVLALVASLLLPTLALAGAQDDDFEECPNPTVRICPGGDDFDDINPIPEPAGALVMSAGLVAAGLVVRRRR